MSGSNWRTEATLFNAGAADTTVTATYRPTDGSAAVERRLPLAPFHGKYYADLLSDCFGVTQGVGTVSLAASDTWAPILASVRVYNALDTGTFSMALPVVDQDSGLPDGRAVFAGITQDEEFRTNLTAVSLNSAGGPQTLLLRLYDANGLFLGSGNLDVPAGGWVQAVGLPNLCGVTEVRDGSIGISGGNGVFVYVTRIDNRTGDPVVMSLAR